ncbi:hypothetical protein [Streptomyces sp. NBC_01446]|uniref:hypothetical protein n=1 Tax=Streptomyces sp. NBC_01446 TaxID=2903870 RepID=UPI00225A3B7D|nr:hypothetical protein [Streptomyces sp. NBC_01446]MCX4643197.1 hypothetical protein [Streptomyces sp. NBC_01446]
MTATLGLASVLLAASCAVPTESEQQSPTPAPTPTRDIERFTLRAPQDDGLGSFSYTKITGSLECLSSGLIAITLEAAEPRDDLLVTLLGGRWNPRPVQGWEQVHADLRGSKPWRRFTQRLCMNGLEHTLSIEVMTMRQREQYGVDGS